VSIDDPSSLNEQYVVVNNKPRMDIILRMLRFSWLVWHSDNDVGHIDKVKLQRDRLVLELVTAFGGSIILVLVQATQPGRPSVGRCNEYWKRLRPPLEKKRRVLRSSGPCCQVYCVLA